MTDVLVVNPPSLWDPERLGHLGQMSYVEFAKTTAGDDGFRTFPGEHLGLMALVAACRARGISAAAVNGQVRQDRSLIETWEGMRQATAEPPAVIGFSGPCQTLSENLWLASQCRMDWPEAVLVFGHDFATLNYRRLLENHADLIDAVVVGEGDEAFPSLCAAVLERRSWDRIPGVASNGPDARVNLAPPPVSPLDLDGLTWVARDDLPAVLAGGMSAGVYGSRGCPYRCSYCTTGQVAGALHRRQGHRLRSVVDLVDEMEMLVRDHAVPHITIVDDLFLTKHPASQARAREFATELRARQLDIPFMIDARVDSIDRATFASLRRAGLHRVFVGVETGSHEQLAAYRKSYGRIGAGESLPAFVTRQLALLNDLGIEVVPGIITFHPDSTAAELLETLTLIDVCGYRGTFQFMNRVFVHPGTTLWHSTRQAGLLDVEWPEPTWHFRDPRAAEVETRALETIGAGADYDTVRRTLLDAVEQWTQADAQPASASPR